MLMGYALNRNGECILSPSFGCIAVDDNLDCVKCAHERKFGISYDFYLENLTKLCMPNSL
jgi:hypothetical protein